MAYMIAKIWRVREALGLNDKKMEAAEREDGRWGQMLKKALRLMVDQGNG